MGYDIEEVVARTIEEYSLMEKTDKVFVALSGGKDSTSILYILKKLGYNVHGLMIDLYLGEWSDIHKKNMEKFCSENDIDLTVVDLKEEIGQGICFVKAVLKKKKGLTGCTVCGIIKRWVLNKWARKLGADVIVTGHNLDDEAQNVLMNYLKGNLLLGLRQGPATGFRSVGVSECRISHKIGDSLSPAILRESLSAEEEKANSQELIIKNLNFIQRVKPLFFVPEGEVRKYAREKKFDILYDRCPCAYGTYRVDTREWMEKNLSDEEKGGIVRGFMAKIRESGLGSGELDEARECEECGEVSRGRVCKFCEIVGNI